MAESVYPPTVDTEFETAAALADNQANPTLPRLGAFLHGLDTDGNWDRLRSEGDDADALAAITVGALRTLGEAYVFNGATWDRLRGTTNGVQVQGAAAHASPVLGNPVLAAGRASAAIPTDVGADGDAASLWTNRNGALLVGAAPHIGLNSDPWNLVHEAVQFTTQQTSATIVLGGASEKIVVMKCQIQAFGTTAFDCQVYFAAAAAFARGTTRAVFDGTFKPSATLAPGVVLDGPFIAGTNGDDLLLTTSAAGSVTVNVWYYVIT